jgi:antibiotic biosynthesis monooxygenase (ABM) superfamily enzyme
MSEAVTVLVTRRVRPGQEQAFTAWLHELANVAKQYPGHQGVTVIPPPAGTDDREYVIVFRFDSQAHLRVWQESDERRAMLARSESMADTPPVDRELTGLEMWFAVPGGLVRQPPPPWEMWLLSSVAIYPLITLLSVTISGPLLGNGPQAVRFAVTTLILGALMTWLVMPRLSRLLASWLYA